VLNLKFPVKLQKIASLASLFLPKLRIVTYLIEPKFTP